MKDQAYYQGGRELHAAGKPAPRHIPHNERQALAVAGWHDADIEAGNYRYFDDDRNPMENKK